MILSDIFKSEETKHYLTIFKKDDIDWLESKIFEKNNKPYLKCLGSDKDRPAKPEEIVRQLWIKRLLEEYSYPKERLQVERPVWFGSGVSDKSADIIILHKDREYPYIIFEVKKPKRKDGRQQLESYCNAEGAPIGVWSNGGETLILHREEPNIFNKLTSIPTVDQTLQDVLTEQWTIDKLTEENKLIRENTTLKKVILDLEDLVLANAEGIEDSFDEIFKLIYSKLYDEWAAANDPTRERKILFRIYGESPTELYDKINGLFKKAKDKWRGVFKASDKIDLKPQHLITCVSFIHDIKLFNADLQIIDDAFEYLSTTVAKKSKGQYFTPRWVIDMCVKMLNPKINERVIDTACGSSGFTVHSLFHVSGCRLTTGFPSHIIDYAGTMLYGIDSSPKAVKIAKALNLIAGDGRTNIYELNSLNPKKWNDEGKAAFRPLLTRFTEDAAKDEENQRDFKYLDFDIVMTNPPFAGPISEKEILRQYRLAEKNGKTISKVGRDILFIERNLNFLRQGGRMAIVLPQGRLNNTNDFYIRNYFFDKARVLAVVGLHVNTFRPHTATKTSVVFLQKYTEEQLKLIQDIQNHYESKWEEHFLELYVLSKKENIIESDITELILSFFDAEFSENDEDVDNSNEEDTQEIESEEQLEERITALKSKLDSMPGRFKGRADLIRTINDAERELAGRTLIGRIKLLVNNSDMLKTYKEIWLNNMSANELDYPIFFAISEKGGKNNSGEPIYNSNFVVEHDLDYIANEFRKFTASEGLDF